jgi:hypothetical protein
LLRARELAQQLRRVADQANEQADRAEQVVKDFERILADRQQPKKPGRKARRPAIADQDQIDEPKGQEE